MAKKMWFIPLGVVATILALYFAEMFISYLKIEESWYVVLMVTLIGVSLLLVLFNIKRV